MWQKWSSSDRERSQNIEKNEAKKRLYNLNNHLKLDDGQLNRSTAFTGNFFNSTNNISNANGQKRNTIKEKRKVELVKTATNSFIWFVKSY